MDESPFLTTCLKSYDARNLREKRVVLTASDIATRLEARPTLSNEDGAAAHILPGKPFDPEPLRVAVASVA